MAENSRHREKGAGDERHRIQCIQDATVARTQVALMDYRAVQEKVTTYMVSFLLAELRLGMTFVNIAAQTKGVKRRRYLGNAKEAYYNVVRLAGRAGLAGEDLHEVEVMLDTLKEAAEQVEPW